MAITQIETHVTDSLERLLTQYRNAPNLTAILRILSDRVQQFEDMAFPVIDGRSLANAVGRQLDGIGEIVGLPRGTLNDAQYALLLRGAIAQNTSDSTQETLLTIIESCFIADDASIHSPYSPGYARVAAPANIGVEVSTPGIDPSLYDLVLRILRNSIAAGVSLSYALTYDKDSAFTLDGPRTGLGLGDVNDAAAGGKLANLIYANSLT